MSTQTINYQGTAYTAPFDVSTSNAVVEGIVAMVSTVTTLGVKAFETVQRNRARRQTERQLHMLNNHALRDIGISRDMISQVAADMTRST